MVTIALVKLTDFTITLIRPKNTVGVGDAKLATTQGMLSNS